MKTFRKFIPIAKIDVSKRLVYGLATCEKEDRAGETCHYETTKPYYEAWSGEISKATDGKSKGNVRAMHGKVAAGKLTELLFDDEGKQFPICAKIIDDAEWKKVEEGVYTGFSQGGRYIKTWKEGDINYYTADPTEVSLVDLPCLPDSTFTAIKADGSEELRKFVTIVNEPSLTDLGMRAEQLSKAVEGGKWQDFVEAARTAIFNEQIEKADKEDPQYPDGDKPAASDGDNKDKSKDKKKKGKKFVEPTGPFWRCDHADHQHLNKVDAIKCMKDEESVRSASEITAPLADAIAKLKDALTLPVVNDLPTLIVEVDKMFTGEDLIAAQAIFKDATDYGVVWSKLEEKFGKDRVKELKPAVQKTTVLNEDVGANEVTLDELVDAFNKEATMQLARSIVKTAKAQNTALEDTAKNAITELLSKGLYDVCRLADLISQLKWLVDSAIFEAQIEGDGSTVGAEMKTAAISLCQCLVAMVQEETAELFEEGDDVAILEMAAGSLTQIQVEQLAKCGAEIGYIETLKTNASVVSNVSKVLELLKAEFEKKGARHSKSDQDNIQQMHDLALQLGADCGSTPDKAATNGDLSKDAENEALRKQIGDLLPMVTALVEDVKALKAQPMPAKAALRQIGKTEDNGGTTTEVSELAAAFEKLSPDERAHELMKLSLKNPIPIAR